MRLHFVSVPVYDSAQAEAELNQFLATHRVIAMDRQLIPDGPRIAHEATPRSQVL
jgi:hypothetical protein